MCPQWTHGTKIRRDKGAVEWIRYYANNAKKLRRMVDKILFKFGGISHKDMDDFYSLANEVFTDALRRYDGVQSFDGFLYSCLSNKVKTEISRRNREKRKIDRMALSMDASLGDEDGCTLGELIADSYDLESEIFRDINAVAYKLERYLAMLSRKQKEVLELLSFCYKASEIQEALHMTPKEYTDALENIRCYERIRILL